MATRAEDPAILKGVHKHNALLRAAIALVAAGILAARAGERPGGRPALVRLGKLAAPTGSALLVAATLGIPLAASRLYLHGVSVDQEFRTQFLGRSATSRGVSGTGGGAARSVGG